MKKITTQTETRFTILSILCRKLGILKEKLGVLKTHLENRNPEALKALSYYEANIIEFYTNDEGDKIGSIIPPLVLSKHELLRRRFKMLCLVLMEFNDEKYLNDASILADAIDFVFKDSDKMLNALEQLTILKYSAEIIT